MNLFSASSDNPYFFKKDKLYIVNAIYYLLHWYELAFF